MKIETFDIRFIEFNQIQPNVDFFLYGSPVYGFRFRKPSTSFGALIEWLNDYYQHPDEPPKKIWINEEGISVFISCTPVEVNEKNNVQLGRFSVGDDWEGESFSFIAPIETVLNTVNRRVRDYYYTHHIEFPSYSETLNWGKLV